MTCTCKAKKGYSLWVCKHGNYKFGKSSLLKPASFITQGGKVLNKGKDTQARSTFQLASSAAHTGLQYPQDVVDVTFDHSRTREWASGNLAVQKADPTKHEESPTRLTFAQVASRADRKVKAFEKPLGSAIAKNKKARADSIIWDIYFWRGVAACARYFKTGENNLGV
jgi:hypothetical protein